MPVTMKEIAAIAGVSRQAVAAALDDIGTSKVSAATREKIREIARRMNYFPNVSARRLKGAASMTIGIYGVPYASVLSQCLFNEMSVFLDRRGYNLMASYGMNEDTAEHAVRGLIAKGVDGLIVTTQYNPVSMWKLSALPSVFVPPGLIEGSDVCVDHAAGTAQAVKALLKKGRKKFIFLNAEDDGIFGIPNMEKYRGFSETLAKAGIEGRLLPLKECGGNTDKLTEIIKEISPDAIFCSNDYFAGRIIAVLTAGGVKIPEDVMVVGYDGLSLCDLCAVPLSTIVQPIRKMAETTVELLLERIKNKTTNHVPADIRLEPVFYPSASTGDVGRKWKDLPVSDYYSNLEANWGGNDFYSSIGNGEK